MSAQVPIISLIDTHCHINTIIEIRLKRSMHPEDASVVLSIINEAAAHNIDKIINVGTSLRESIDCVFLTTLSRNVFAVIGIHPNDAQDNWKDDLLQLKKLLINNPEKIVGIGECGIDKHYPNFNLSRQQDLFKAQIEMALEYNLALVIHSRDAADETLSILDEYSKDIKRLIMHCYSYNRSIGKELIEKGYMLGIGGPITYPKNKELHALVKEMPLANLVLETDAPFLPIQLKRGEENHPKYIYSIAQSISELRAVALTEIATQTTENAKKLFEKL